jgi:hypothetical protein
MQLPLAAGCIQLSVPSAVATVAVGQNPLQTLPYCLPWLLLVLHFNVNSDPLAAAK